MISIFLQLLNWHWKWNHHFKD